MRGGLGPGAEFRSSRVYRGSRHAVTILKSALGNGEHSELFKITESYRPGTEGRARLPAGAWGVVTSGHRSLAERRLRAVGLPVPQAMVCGDEITHGKPDPEGYLAGARLLGVPPGACVAFEDAPAGILAAHRAGMPVVGITTTHAAASLTGATVVIDDLTEFDAALAIIARGTSGGPFAAPR